MLEESIFSVFQDLKEIFLLTPLNFYFTFRPNIYVNKTVNINDITKQDYQISECNNLVKINFLMLFLYPYWIFQFWFLFCEYFNCLPWFWTKGNLQTLHFLSDFCITEHRPSFRKYIAWSKGMKIQRTLSEPRTSPEKYHKTTSLIMCPSWLLHYKMINSHI